MSVLDVSWCVATAGIVLAVGALVVFGTPLPALRVALDLLTAAGLLRLTVDASWATIAATAMLIALRRVITHSLIADLSTSRRWTHGVR